MSPPPYYNSLITAFKGPVLTYDFDRIIDRRASESEKWLLYDREVLPMWLADMDFASPPEVVEALASRVRHGVFGYPVVQDQLRQTVAGWLLRRHGWQTDPAHILFYPDVVHGINLAAHALCQPGDGVLFHTPAFPPFLQVAGNAHLLQHENALIGNTDGHYTIDFDAFARAMTPDVKLFILCNPQNPTGRVFTREELSRIAELCLDRGVTVIADEIHCDLVFAPHKHIPFASLDEAVARNTITLMSPSKTFNTAGASAAFMIVSNEVTHRKIAQAGGGLAGSVNVFGLTVLQACYEHGEPWLEALIAYLQSNRDYLHAVIQSGELPGISMGLPEATYLAWLDCRSLGLGANPAQFFLERGKVGLNSGLKYGERGQGFTRLTYGCPRSLLEAGLQRVRTALDTL